MDTLFLSCDGAEARIAHLGAELQHLRLGGLDLLWEAGPLWPRHAPLLFPIVGALREDTLTLQGRRHTLPKHGFARDLPFAWTLREPARCALELTDTPATHAAYPFPFRLGVAYTLTANRLRMEVTLHNPGPAPLPASLGLHPAFRWPLVPACPKRSHRLVFDEAEPAPVHRLTPQGLLDPAPRPSPIQGRQLPLDECLFTEDALLFLSPRSRGLAFEAEGGPTVRLAWEGFPHLGIWTKPDPGPSYLCIEPWEGHADPADWAGDFASKPGSFRVPPGEHRTWSLTVACA